MAYPYVNEVKLVGRLSGGPRRRRLSTGAELAEWRLVIERSPRAPEAGRRIVVDTIGCVTFDERIGADAGRWRHGDLLTVRGALRRWFWRAPYGAASRYQVEVHRVEVLRVEPVAPEPASAGHPGSPP